MLILDFNPLLVVIKLGVLAPLFSFKNMSLILKLDFNEVFLKSEFLNKFFVLFKAVSRMLKRVNFDVLDNFWPLLFPLNLEQLLGRVMELMLWLF